MEHDVTQFTVSCGLNTVKFYSVVPGFDYYLIIGCRDSVFPGFPQYLQVSDKVFDPFNRTQLASYRSLFTDNSRSTYLDVNSHTIL